MDDLADLDDYDAGVPCTWHRSCARNRRSLGWPFRLGAAAGGPGLRCWPGMLLLLRGTAVPALAQGHEGGESICETFLADSPSLVPFQDSYYHPTNMYYL